MSKGVKNPGRGTVNTRERVTAEGGRFRPPLLGGLPRERVSSVFGKKILYQPEIS